ncbi:MAG TPA: Coq4 family protein [Rhizomicrobium sp.]|nr:Coq4 family protein [Rhizomicrobium sp.]
MSTPFTQPASEAATFGRLPLQPLHALRALRKLIANKEETVHVFEIIKALSGKSIFNGYQRMLTIPEGARQAYLRPEMAAKLSDDAWLATFAPGTVGAHYREFINLRSFAADGLVGESRKASDTADVDSAHPVAWYARRIRDIHDIWHVLTGYRTDTLGEASILAFTHGQVKNRGVAFIVMAAAFEMTRSHPHPQYIRAMLEGYRHGKAAKWLPAEDYDALFAEPLEAARKRLNIQAPVIYESVPLEARNAYRDSEDRELRIAQKAA